MKSGGDTAGEGGRQGPHGRGWVDGGSATVGKLLSVKYVEPLDALYSHNDGVGHTA